MRLQKEMQRWLLGSGLRYLFASELLMEAQGRCLKGSAELLNFLLVFESGPELANHQETG